MADKKTSSRRDDKPPVKPAPPRPDWEAVERDYRTGRFTLRELEAKHGPANSTIARRAERQGWTKDLTEAIRQATNAKLVAEIATQQACSTAQQDAAATVLAAAEINTQVIRAHRKRVGQATDVAMRMLAELDTTTSRPDQIEALFDVLTDELDERGKAAAQQQLREFLRLHSRVSSVQKLMDALGKAQNLERQAFGIRDGEGESGKNKPAPSVYDITDDDLVAEILAGRAARREAA